MTLRETPGDVASGREALRGWTPLLLGVVAYVLLWWVYPHTIEASDPWMYSRNAHALATNPASLLSHAENHPFVHRLAVTGPLAVVYAALGVDVVTTHLWSLCCALLVLLTVWLALPDRRSRLVGLVFGVTCVPLFRQAVNLYPDLVCAAFMGLSSYFLFNRRWAVRGAHGLVPIAAVACLFVAFLAKETACWAAPLWLYVLVSDVRRRDRPLLVRFYVPAAASGVVLGLAYLSFCHLVWGDPFARLASVEALGGHHLWSWDKASTLRLLARVTLSPGSLFLVDYGGVALLALFSARLVPPSHRFWLVYTGVTVFLFWFGSTSLSSYQPLPVTSRMALPALPGILIVASLSASRLIADVDRLSKPRRRAALAVALGLILLPPCVHAVTWRAAESAEIDAMAEVRRRVASEPGRSFALVCSDSRSPQFLAFYFAYEVPPNLRVIAAHDAADNELAGVDAAFLYVNERRSRFLASAYGKPSYDGILKAPGATPLLEREGVALYATTDMQALSRWREAASAPAQPE